MTTEIEFCVSKETGIDENKRTKKTGIGNQMDIWIQKNNNILMFDDVFYVKGYAFFSF